MRTFPFEDDFEALTGNKPFPWMQTLYHEWMAKGEFPSSCNIPTGLGKTSVIAVWLVALANHHDKLPRRLVYVVNRRTVVDQTTTEAEKLRAKLRAAGLFDSLKLLCAMPLREDESPLAISTLRGQFADNREWSADPSRPAVIVGTVDIIGSRLLLSGYGIGFKSRPLHAGFLGQDVLLVHDEAHLEPAFQDLLLAIEGEQKRSKEHARFQVMELSATSRGSTNTIHLGPADHNDPEVEKRIGANKTICLHENADEKKLADEIAALAREHKGSGAAVLVFVRTVDEVDRIAKGLPKGSTEQLTGTLRGLERDGLVKKPIFQRFLPISNRDKNVTPAEGTVYLVCTSAGEVGVNISADHLVCDLSTFDSMAQRFGRVNRFGDRDDTRIDVVLPKRFEENDLGVRRTKTLDLLRQLQGNGSPEALGALDSEARVAAFAPPPTVLPVSDVLFDAWALTTIRGNLPGRPAVEPYLHGISAWEPPETHVAWREEVGIITGDLLDQYDLSDLLEDYPLKPHELLRDISSRVFERLKKLKAPAETPVWVVSDENTVNVVSLTELREAGREGIEHQTVLLPPSAGGIEGGMLSDTSDVANDVADELFDNTGIRRRVRVWDDDPDFEAKTENMRLVRRIDLAGSDEDEEGRSWHWFELPMDGDTDGSKSNQKPVLWRVHTDDVINHAAACVAKLSLPQELKDAIILAARWHDLGKQRKQFQTVLGNLSYPDIVLAKSGKRGGRVPELYRHEFGSLVDVLDEYRAELHKLSPNMQEVVLHLIAAHHGYGRPHFPADRAFDPEPKGQKADEIAAAVAQRFARLQRLYGRWGLAYLESLLRAADYAASATPSAFVEVES
jgi:CRISPR-associated endonuclease/helicase Cas3